MHSPYLHDHNAGPAQNTFFETERKQGLRIKTNTALLSFLQSVDQEWLTTTTRQIQHNLVSFYLKVLLSLLLRRGWWRWTERVRPWTHKSHHGLRRWRRGKLLGHQGLWSWSSPRLWRWGGTLTKWALWWSWLVLLPSAWPTITDTTWLRHSTCPWAVPSCSTTVVALVLIAWAVAIPAIPAAISVRRWGRRSVITARAPISAVAAATPAVFATGASTSAGGTHAPITLILVHQVGVVGVGTTVTHPSS